MFKFARLSVVLLLVILSSCGKSLPVLDGVDPITWKNDKNACAGKRLEMIEGIRAQKEKLLALSELEIVELLGKPDQNELYKRNQKFYYYFVQPSVECDSSNADHPTRLVIRFNAMGLAKEISVEK
jgi:hypothetical protein